MDTLAVLMDAPGKLGLQRVGIVEPSADDVVVDVLWSGISTGTERLLYSGRMPDFPGMGYPLVPGYETVGKVTDAGPSSVRQVGDLVFVPGARCFTDVHALFGGAARKLVVPSARAVKVTEQLGKHSVLLALAATAHHAVAGGDPPELIVGHGVLGRLIARISIALGNPAPVVFEQDQKRMEGATGYAVVHPDAAATDAAFKTICDVSGDSKIVDSLVRHLTPGGEIILAGFYSERISFDFPGAFMREARLRVAAQWAPADLAAVADLSARGALSFDGLITHELPAANAKDAYDRAFSDPECLKMVLDWREQAL